jgi:hypothetical protein
MSRVAQSLLAVVVLLIGSVALVSPAAGADSAPLRPGPSRPPLVTSHAAICASLAPDVRSAFQSEFPLGDPQPSYSVTFGPLTQVTEPTARSEHGPGFFRDRNDPTRAIFVQPDGEKVFTYSIPAPGCRGACQGTTVLVSGKPESVVRRCLPPTTLGGSRAALVHLAFLDPPSPITSFQRNLAPSALPAGRSHSPISGLVSGEVES